MHVVNLLDIAVRLYVTKLRHTFGLRFLRLRTRNKTKQFNTDTSPTLQSPRSRQLRIVRTTSHSHQK